MSVSALCQFFQSSTSCGNWNNWKETLFNITDSLESDNHPDKQHFEHVATTLMMTDRPGYWQWLHSSITKLINDPKSRLDQIPNLLDYDEMSSQELVNKYEIDDRNYSRQDILAELKKRYPFLVESTGLETSLNLPDLLKNVL